MKRYVVVLVLVACVQSNSVICNDVICAVGRVCAPDGMRCVAQDQLDACVGAADGKACSYSGVTAGVCVALVCVPAGCGNGIVEIAAGEQCDDGNRVSFDGCNATCTSDEQCGNGVVDAVLGEACDCGNGTHAPPMGCAMANLMAAGAQCRPDCTPAGCGDHVVDPFERCDDGNTLPGDGCRVDCLGRWTPMATPTQRAVLAIWARSATDVFAVGGGLLMHFDGVAWTKMTPPVPSTEYVAVWGTATRVYAAWRFGTTGGIDVYDGSTWQTDVSIAEDPRGMWGDGTDVYLATTATHSNPVIYKRTPSGWDAGTTLPNTTVSGIWGFSASDIYVVGGASTYHWDGLSWSPLAAPGETVWGSGPADVYIFANTGVLHHRTTSGWADVAFTFDEALGSLVLGGTGPNDVLLVGQAGWMYHFDGTAWSAMGSSTTSDLTSITMLAPGRALVAGYDGTILY